MASNPSTLFLGQASHRLELNLATIGPPAKLPFERRFAGEPIAPRFYLLTGNAGLLLVYALMLSSVMVTTLPEFVSGKTISSKVCGPSGVETHDPT